MSSNIVKQNTFIPKSLTFTDSINSFFTAFGFIIKNKLTYFYFFPLLLQIVLLISLTASIASGVDLLIEFICNYFNISMVDSKSTWFFLSKSFLINAAKFGIAILIKIVTWILLFKINKYIVLILLSPVFALLSEIVEEKLTGKKYPFSFYQLCKDVWRGVLLATRNMFIEFFWVAILFFSGLIFFPLAPIFAIISFVIGCYFLGFSTIDYNCERKKMNISESIQFIRNNKWYAIGNGFAFYILFKIPILGGIIAPINATVAATIDTCKLHNNT